MLAPWLIDAIRKEEQEQARRDRASWDKQDSVEVDDSFRRPPPRAAEPTAPGERHDGGIVTIDFSL